MKVSKKQICGIIFTFLGFILCLGSIFIENLLAVPGFLLLIGGLLAWNPGGIMEIVFPPFR